MILKSTLLTLSFLVIVLNTFQSSPVFAQEPDSIRKALTVGEEAPMFVLKDLSGEYVYLRDYTGKKLRQPWKQSIKNVVVVSFFATWCIPCKTEIPILGEIATTYVDKPLKIYLVDLKEKATIVVPFLEEFDVSIQVLMDEYGVAAEKFGVVALPHLFLIDKEGIVRYFSRGLKEPEEFRSNLITSIDIWLNIEN